MPTEFFSFDLLNFQLLKIYTAETVGRPVTWKGCAWEWAQTTKRTIPVNAS